jgi:hypothetical protein
MSLFQVDQILGSTGTGGVAVQGKNTNAAAAAGFVGEVISNNVSNASIAVDGSGRGIITSIVLTPGSWSLGGNILSAPGGSGGLPTASGVFGALSTSNTGDASYGTDFCYFELVTSSNSASNTVIPLLGDIVRVATTTTYYLKLRDSTAASSSVTLSCRFFATRIL